METRNESEKLFEQYLDHNGFEGKWEHEPTIEGKIKRSVSIEVFRSEEKIGQGRLINLQRNKKDIDQCQKGEECGILFEGNIRIEEGDILKIYTEERRKGEL